ncbi:protein-L-isoaspartate O-methyltransferase [Streptomyces syringium]|uniref:Protein-L-isoaspartate O-methyltransferase n=1 Tax=Streptomyces syringium TaxID=76729 RepID=A0ABS4XW97_9ACTN|nr:protein-L-isoaspartate O-methyltransferase [Streptomyces syringium]MBP2400789.1 protein-L-isoaspartate O-methyltransferase [Streptomyces syringium]
MDRATAEGRWAQEVYGGPDDLTITQVTNGPATSSLSCEAVVADMLDCLMLEPGHRVLELGTGQGRNSALMAWRTGPGLITSVEKDAGLAAAAQRSLDAVHAGVAVRTGDGVTGWPHGTPYDRVISTYAVEDVPWSWIEKTRPGGRIVTPWGRLGHVALTVAEDGRTATGWMQGLAAFMPSRTATSRRGWAQVRGDQAPDEEQPFTSDLSPLREPDVLFAVRVALPDVAVITRPGESGIGVDTWLHDGRTSWASITAPGGGIPTAYRGGPRHLLDEVQSAIAYWRAQGKPSLWDFGMTVSAHRQYTWCKSPSNGAYGPPPVREPTWDTTGSVNPR